MFIHTQHNCYPYGDPGCMHCRLSVYFIHICVWIWSRSISHHEDPVIRNHLSKTSGRPASATMSGNKLKTARVISVIAATAISLACGTNVVTLAILSLCNPLTALIVCVLGMGTSICRKVEALFNPEQFDCALSTLTSHQTCISSIAGHIRQLGHVCRRNPDRPTG